MDIKEEQLFLQMLKDHDWYYMYSDDRKYYDRGCYQWEAIVNMKRSNPDLQAIYETYRQEFVA